ncbi:Transglutaminase-like superfamily protein [uncultured archaeon]|nr:Transglutaminase-like superfamily protein [uncultured archaeon]
MAANVAQMAARMKWFLVFAVAALAVSPWAFAVDPVLVDETNFTLVESGIVSATRGGMVNLHLNVSVPGNFSYQSVRFSGPLVPDAEGNLFTSIFEESPGNPYRFSVSSEGSTRSRLTPALPDAYTVPFEIGYYALPSAGIQSDDARILELASSIAANSSSDWERVVKLADFVNSYVEYDLTLAGAEEDAVWVLENRRGVCVEYAHLYAALARSLGIPTRILTGYAFGREGSWFGHTWAESYIGEWVPVDPTWLEAGYLDGTHIQASRSTSEFFETRASALVEHGAGISVMSDDVFGGITQGVGVTGISESPALPPPVVAAGASTMHFGSSTVVYAKVRSPDYRLVELRLIPCTGTSGQPIWILDGDTRVVAARAGVEEFVSWRVRSNPDLPAAYMWTCPLLLSSNFFADSGVDLALTPQETGEPVIAASLSKSSVTLGENETVYYELSGAPQGSTVGFATDSGVAKLAAAQGRREYSFMPGKLGLNRVIVFSSAGNAVELSFNVTLESRLSVESTGFTRTAIEGKPMTVLIILSNPSAEPESALVTASLGGQTASTRVSVAETENVYLTLTPDASGNSTIEVALSGEGIYENFSLPVEVQPKPFVNASTIRFAFIGSRTTVILNLTGEGEPFMVNASINGMKSAAGFGEVILESDPGEKLFSLEWLDAAGNYYNSSGNITVPAEGGETPTPSPTVSGETQGFPVNAMLLCAGILAAAAIVTAAFFLFFRKPA